MPSQPDGIPWPPDSHIWERARREGAGIPFSAYVHVPFCTVRCGYCDFNTYTTGFGQGADLETYASSVHLEIAQSRRQLGDAARPFSTVFFGGGTPTLLTPAAFGQILGSLYDEFGVAADAEITVEANPETLTREALFALRDLGVNRLSIGMQSSVQRVLDVLDRVHNPGSVPQAVDWAREAGLSVSVDLIFGAPGESLSDWQASLQSAIGMEPDHVSAYSLIVEPGTKLAAQIDRGKVASPNEDLSADKYVMTDELLGEAGYRWYEISNFAKVGPGESETPGTQLRSASKHNLAYWRDWNWWGYGPGAHSHWGGLRWWNVKHPLAYAGKLASKQEPGIAGEQLDDDTRRLERLMLGIRTAEGVPIEPWLAGTDRLVEDGLLEETVPGRLVATLRGRLLADHVTRVLAGWEERI